MTMEDISVKEKDMYLPMQFVVGMLRVVGTGRPDSSGSLQHVYHQRNQLLTSIVGKEMIA